MDSYSDSLTKIGLGFRSAGELSLVIIIIVLSIIAFFIIYQGIKNYLQGYRAISSVRSENTGNAGNAGHSFAGLLKNREAMNAAQIKAVYDIISDFKRKEILAEAIPVSVLEHFAEYFYRNMDRLNISKSMAKIFSPSLFPLPADTPVEIELVHNNKLYIFEKNVVERTDKKILVHKIDSLSELSGEGKTVTVSYISNKIYIQGESRILKVNDRDMLVLSYPRNLVISKERRFSRVPVQKEVNAFLTQALHPETEKIKARIKDISMEGLRIETGSILKKNVIYLIGFEDKHFETPYVFENFECTVTKSMISDQNLFEYGLAFVYINLTNRTKLANYINEWVNPFKIGTAPNA